MRWPWVSQDTLVEIIKLGADTAAKVDQKWQARYDLLLERYHALKLQGASQPEPAATLERPAFDPVQAAITAKAGPDRKLRALMGREAAQARTLGIPDDEIIRQIESGVEIDDGIPV